MFFTREYDAGRAGSARASTSSPRIYCSHIAYAQSSLTPAVCRLSAARYRWRETQEQPGASGATSSRRPFGIRTAAEGLDCSACSPACTPDRRLQKAGRLSTAVLSLHLNLVLFYYSSSASSASACASFATSWPDFTLSPSLTQTFSTVPSMVAITLVSIFIASITATG